MTVVQDVRVGGPWRWLVAVAFNGGAVVLGLRSGQGALGVEVTVGATMITLVLHLVIHESGHLLVAVLAGLRVTGVRISLRSTSHSAVWVQPKPLSAGLPVRMVALALGGPCANFAAAALTYQLTFGPMPALARYALFASAAAGAAQGVANLLPYRMMSGLRSDGANVLRWTFRSGQARAELDHRQRAAQTAQTVRTIADGTVDGAQLDKIISSVDDPLVFFAAVERRWQVGTDRDSSRFVAEANRLSAIAHDKRTDPAHAGLIAKRLATLFGMLYLHAAIVDSVPVGRADADEITDIAELGARLLPDDVGARIGLAIARLLNHRPAEASRLLIGVQISTTGVYALACQVRAIAEIYLGDQAQADRFVAAAGTGDRGMHEILAALSASGTAGQLPILVQTQPQPDGTRQAPQSPTA